MKNSVVIFTLLYCLVSHSAMRDPFLPPTDGCLDTRWSKWRFHGAVGQASSLKALVANPEGKWLRISAGQQIADDLRVLTVSTDGVVLSTPSVCEQNEIRWQRKEKNHEKDWQVNRAAVAPSERAGGKPDK